ncbi:MAG TPA: class I SAM-dependent methyltransferase [Pyrinomonadaceae bacterium]|nr:class I SAM-dependent methyltransferase [Pyrinomonadaceae bacterium]
MSASFIPDRYVEVHNTSLSPAHRFPVFGEQAHGLVNGVVRRLRRERRRRKVGRAYDMALEIARVLPLQSSVLDVGCGNGYIAHHLSALLGSTVLGLDLATSTEAPIAYRQFDGARFPVGANTVDAILLCYVLHHAQDIESLTSELRRVLKPTGIVVVYEDIPEAWWDRLVCAVHDLKWRGRTGSCHFRLATQWQGLFSAAGFRTVTTRTLSRWRNLAHPVSRNFFVLTPDPNIIYSAL